MDQNSEYGKLKKKRKPFCIRNKLSIKKLGIQTIENFALAILKIFGLPFMKVCMYTISFKIEKRFIKSELNNYFS